MSDFENNRSTEAFVEDQSTRMEPADDEPICAPKTLDPQKRKRLMRILLILLVVAIPLSAALIYNANWNFYDTTLRHLSFDYREGEANGALLEQETSVYAEPLALEIKNEAVQLEASVCIYNTAGGLSTSVSTYNYAHTDQYSLLQVRTGVENWFRTASKTLRQVGDVCSVEQDGQWLEDPLSRVPDLYSFFFRVNDTDTASMEYLDSFVTTVDGKSYSCEIWLLEDSHSSNPHYYTLYRYYSSTRLAAVRVMESQSDLMEVYDITAYDCNPQLSPLAQ